MGWTCLPGFPEVPKCDQVRACSNAGSRFRAEDLGVRICAQQYRVRVHCMVKEGSLSSAPVGFSLRVTGGFKFVESGAQESQRSRKASNTPVSFSAAVGQR